VSTHHQDRVTAGLPRAAGRRQQPQLPGAPHAGPAVADRIRRDVDSGLASGQVLGTPTLFIDGVVHRGGYDPPALLAALARWR
jgi:protein-disulfide isomerase